MIENKTIIEKIKEQPQTYSTLLDSSTNFTTERIIASRKINKLWYFGFIKKTIYGKWGECLFYHPEKTYSIFILKNGFDKEVFYCFDYEESKNEVTLKNPYKLSDGVWQKTEGKTLINKKVLLQVL
jgi:hypothetical protein